MANIKLKNASGTETTYTGVTKIKVPLADGTGNAEFSEGGGSWEAPVITIFRWSTMAGSGSANFSVTYSSTTKTMAELIAYAVEKGRELNAPNHTSDRGTYFLTASDILDIYGVDVSSSRYSFTFHPITYTGDNALYIFELGQEYTMSTTLSKITSDTNFQIGFSASSPAVFNSVMLITGFDD